MRVTGNMGSVRELLSIESKRSNRLGDEVACRLAKPDVSFLELIRRAIEELLKGEL